MQIQVRSNYIFREFPQKWNVMEATIWFNGLFYVSFSRLWLKSSITYQISLSWCTCWLWFKVWFVVNMMCDVWSVVYCSGGQWRGKHWNCPLIFPPQGLLSLPAQSTACLSWIEKRFFSVLADWNPKTTKQCISLHLVQFWKQTDCPWTLNLYP